jgi:ribose transport system substrate-binding protein
MGGLFMGNLAILLKGSLVASALVLSAAASQAADGPKVAVDLTTLTSPFWTAYNRYIVNEAKAQGIDLLQPFNSEFDTSKQITGVQNAITLGAKGLIFSPFESAAAGTILKLAEKAKVAVVAVDVAPTTGPVAIVVRADNVAYGEKACKFIGDHVPEGPVVQIMGDQASINGRDRGVGFRDCIKKNYPKLKLLEIPTKAWSGEDAAAGLDTILNSTPDLKAIYMHAGGVFLAPTLQTLKRKGMLKTVGQPGHIVIVSNDGIPQEFDAIRKGEADATVSQPADLYAKYGLQYLKEAIGGKTFKAGPTDHDSKIVEVAPGVLEDQLGAPLVTKENVDDKSFWGNQL